MPWATTTPMPAPANHHDLVAVGDHLVLTGGDNGGGYATVHVAHVGADGQLGAWTAGPSLPQARTLHASAVVDRRVFVTGGLVSFGDQLPVASVLHATLDENGVLDAWVADDDLPEARAWHAAAASATHLYVVGGMIDGVELVGSAGVYVAPLEADGIGAWSETTPLPTPFFGHEVIVHEGSIWSIGGFNGSGTQATVHQAALDVDGEVGEWQTATPLPAPRFAHEVVAFPNGLAYVTGGYVLGTPDGGQDDVWVGLYCTPDGE
jgi:hypothetical protein